MFSMQCQRGQRGLEDVLLVPERQRLTTMTADVLFRRVPLWLGAKGGNLAVLLVCLG